MDLFLSTILWTNNHGRISTTFLKAFYPIPCLLILPSDLLPAYSTSLLCPFTTLSQVDTNLQPSVTNYNVCNHLQTPFSPATDDYSCHRHMLNCIEDPLLMNFATWTEITCLFSSCGLVFITFQLLPICSNHWHLICLITPPSQGFHH